MVTSIFIDNLSQEDRQSPQITNLLPLLCRGIEIYHGGLLPILKEVIEILFQEGLIKVLSQQKHARQNCGLHHCTKIRRTRVQKYISSSEYIQLVVRVVVVWMIVGLSS